MKINGLVIYIFYTLIIDFGLLSNSMEYDCADILFVIKLKAEIYLLPETPRPLQLYGIDDF